MALVEKIKLENGAVEWHFNEVLLTIKNATSQAMEAAAFSVEGRAKINMEANGNVDTGFAINSIGTVFQGGNGTYGTGVQSGFYPWDPAKHGGATGDVEQTLLPAEPLPQDGITTAVQVGAEYAIFIEANNPFLYLALQQEAAFLGVTLQEHTKKAGL